MSPLGIMSNLVEAFHLATSLVNPPGTSSDMKLMFVCSILLVGLTLFWVCGVLFLLKRPLHKKIDVERRLRAMKCFVVILLMLPILVAGYVWFYQSVYPRKPLAIRHRIEDDPYLNMRR